MNDAEREALGAALGRVPSGLFIVTLRQGEATSAFLASWVMQAAFEPPCISLGVKKGRAALDLLSQGAQLAVNIVPKGDKLLLAHFARGFAPGEDPFVGVATQMGVSGVEILPDALAVLECRQLDRMPVGDHVIVLAEVVAGQLQHQDQEPACHVRKNGFQY